MPPHADRLDRLEELLKLARTLFAEGSANVDGRQVKVSELPVAPSVRPLRICLSVAGPLVSLKLLAVTRITSTLTPPHRVSKVESQRKLMTTTEDLEQSMEIVRHATAAERRPAPTSSSDIVTEVEFVENLKSGQNLNGSARLPACLRRHFWITQFVLIGEPQRMARGFSNDRTG
jgi:hypothetical protein